MAWVVRRGRLFHDRNWGDGKDSQPALLASAKADGSLEVLVTFDFGKKHGKQTRQFSFIKDADGRIRAMSNRNVDTDEYSIVNGKFAFNGKATRWQTRCR